jgi:DNA-binding SARP family transcriptional activator/class 3 adenylate cyclase
VEFRVLGPLEVFTAGGAVSVTGPKRRALLARFLVSAGETLSAATLADDLWQGSPPRSSTTTLQTFVYQLRRRYGIEALRTTPAGYVLELDPAQFDSHAFEVAVRDATAIAARDPRAAMVALRAAIDMWRGDAYVEFATEPWALAEATRLDQLRVDAVEAWAAAAIGAGECSGLPAELEAWTSRYPLRESLWALRVLALARDGRGAEALRVVTNLRDVLRDELGVDPSSAFATIETAMLRDEPLPAWPELGGFGFQPARETTAEMRAHPAAGPPVARQSRRGRGRRPESFLRSVPTSPPPSTDVFVGRVAELEMLESALERASSGLPQVVVMRGAAGIGKSRLLDEFTPHAISRGVQVLVGTCQEDVSVPYLPLASAFNTLDLPANPFESAAPTHLDGDDDGARLALYLATTRALLTAARARVSMLVIEDLHWVDDATLSLLRHMLAVVGEDGETVRARLLVVVTTRHPEPGSGAASLVARLRREARASVVDLRSLSEPECRELIGEWLGASPSRATLGRLLEMTAGNPLVLRSALGRLRALGSPVTESTLVDLVGPTDLDHELWRRVEQVGDECSEMLVSAAFLGDGATLEYLAATCALDPVVLDDLIDEAAAQQVLVADDERYWFDHPQLRQLLYHWPGAEARAARHLQLADRLTPIGADVRMVAHHLVRADDVVDPARMHAVCGDAADRSAAVGAWRDAARYAAGAFAAAEKLGLPEENLAEMQLRAGHTALLAQDSDIALALLGAAAERARLCGAVNVWGRAVVLLARERVGTVDLQAAAARSLASLDEFLDHGHGDAALRGEAHALEGELYFDLGDLGAANRHNVTAGELALEANDDTLRVKVGFARGLQHLGSIELPEARARFEAVSPIAANLADPNPHIWCTSRLGLVAYAGGDLDRADGFLSDAVDAARGAENLRELSMAAAFQASVAAARGRFATVELNAERALHAHREAETPFTPGVAFPAMAAARAHRGDGAGAHAALDEWDEVRKGASRRYRPLVDACVGDLEAVARVLEHPNFRLFAVLRQPSLFVTGAIAAQVEVGARAGRPDVVVEPLETLMDLYDRGMVFAVGWPSFVPRVVALGLVVSGRDEDAWAWFDRALADARAASATAEVARTAADHAHALGVSMPASPRVSELSAIAAEANATLFDAPVEPRTGPRVDLRAARPLVAASAGPSNGRGAGPATRVMLVTDLVGSTALNDRLGDHEYVEHLRVHDEIIRRRLAECDGVEFKHTGDGIGAWFFSVSAALRCAAAVAGDFTSSATEPLHVKIALSAGEPTMVERDLIGLAVTVAFRVLELAQPGDVLVTADVAGIARGLDWSFEPRGTHRLKGMHAPIEILRAVLAE